MNNTKNDKKASGKINFRDLISYDDCLRRMKAYYGVELDKEVREALGINQSTFSMAKKESRGFPFEVIATFCFKEKKSFDWALFGDQGMCFNFVGNPIVKAKMGALDISGVNVGSGTNITNITGENRQISPMMERLIQILEYYGSPAIFDEIEKLIADKYNIDTPVKLPNK